MVRIPTAEPRTPPIGDVRVGVPVQATTIGAFVEAAAHLIGLRIRRSAHNIVAYDISATPLVEQSPKGVESTVPTIWPVSPRATHVWVWARVQADRGEDERTQEVTAGLYAVSDGEELDKGIVWDANLLDGAVAGDNDDEYPLREIHSGFRTISGVDAATPPRLLNIPADTAAGTLLELRMTATDARLVSISLWELAPAAMEQSE